MTESLFEKMAQSIIDGEVEDAEALAHEIVANHKVPPLPDETLASLQAILHEADGKAGVKP